MDNILPPGLHILERDTWSPCHTSAPRQEGWCFAPAIWVLLVGPTRYCEYQVTAFCHSMMQYDQHNSPKYTMTRFTLLQISVLLRRSNGFEVQEATV